jgi:hypothetical protein
MLRGRPPFLIMDGIQAAQVAALEKVRPIIPTNATFAPPLAELLRTTWCDVPSERITFDKVNPPPPLSPVIRARTLPSAHLVAPACKLCPVI